ncbi:MAG: bifunctional DNA-formamidopyrimidine glycosylase/DNA-(apurinic or apyrimidinic site) lyase [Burkholderiales bacterium]|nr:bifunctional DNA-formamidopyrimidine glycosylase/DNA-(apurinic or apyrimidinic site) lyase [Burkholderiales bacterium]
MPELPEVEVTRQGIAPHLTGRRIDTVVVRDARLRWPIDARLATILTGLSIAAVGRRGKYLLLSCERHGKTVGTLIVHLGMSGSLRLVAPGTPAARHAHFDLVAGDAVLRLTDPRRFGAVLWHPADGGPTDRHPLLAKLGVEPFTDAFTAELMHERTRGRRVSVKEALLAGGIVVGVGNIYASESLFRSGIRPQTPAGRVSLARYRRLVVEVRRVLAMAIRKGGSTLKDFSRSDGEPGSFQLEYRVYDRAGLPCRICATPIRRLVQGQRSTFYCPRCQT